VVEDDLARQVIENPCGTILSSAEPAGGSRGRNAGWWFVHDIKFGSTGNPMWLPWAGTQACPYPTSFMAVPEFFDPVQP